MTVAGFVAVFFMLTGLFGGVVIGRMAEYNRLKEDLGKGEGIITRPRSLFLLIFFLLFAVSAVSGLALLIGGPSLSGHPAAIRGTDQIEGDIYPYQLVDGQLLFGQIKDNEAICRIVDWESFHPSERSKIVLPGLKSYTFINTPHGIEVKEKKEAPEQ